MRFRITETPLGGFRIGVQSEGMDQNHWAKACDNDFRTKEDAEAGLKRIIAAREWRYDANGDPI